MTVGQIVIRSSPVALGRRHRLLTGTLTPASTPTTTPTKSPTTTPTPPRTSPNSSANVGEVAGGTAAGCLVVCCCCPCVLVEFLFLAVYKLPATVLRRIYHKRRKKMKKKKGLLKQAAEGAGSGVCEVHRKRYCDELSDVDLKEFEKVKVSIDGSAEAVELDRQMWAQFHNSGFGRSLSQRHSFMLE